MAQGEAPSSGDCSQDDIKLKGFSANSPTVDSQQPSNSTSNLNADAFGDLLLDCLNQIHLSVTSNDFRITARMLRRISTLRKLYTAETFLVFNERILIAANRPRGVMLRDVLDLLKTSHLKTSMRQNDGVEASEPICSMKPQDATTKDVTSVAEVLLPSKAESKENEEPGWQAVVDRWTAPGSSHPYAESIEETDLFLTTLTLMVLADHRKTKESLPIAESVVKQLSSFQPRKRVEGLIVAKAVFWVGRTYELYQRLSNVRGFLMKMFRTSFLHHDMMTQAVSLNLLLRDFLQNDLYDQAVQLLEKCPYPEMLRSNAQHARYLYYLARINAVRLNYGEAHARVTQAIRKAPQEGLSVGRGFRLAAYKLSVIIHLLMGDIPDRGLFAQRDVRQALAPYAQMVQAVRSGDLALFKTVVEKHAAFFSYDGNLILVQRLHHNVIRAGLRRITASYSRISIKDVAAQLGLDSTDDTNCIVSKAITDGVIDASIDYDTQILISKSPTEGQVTADPQKAFHGRIAFCLQLHSEAMKAMQYPEPEEESRTAEAEARRKEHQEQLARAEKDEFDGDATDLI